MPVSISISIFIYTPLTIYIYTYIFISLPVLVTAPDPISHSVWRAHTKCKREESLPRTYTLGRAQYLAHRGERSILEDGGGLDEQEGKMGGERQKKEENERQREIRKEKKMERKGKREKDGSCLI